MLLLLLFLFISTDYTNSHLLKELEELSKDDVVEVKCTALSVLADMIPLVDQGMQRDLMIPCSTCINMYIIYIYIIYYYFCKGVSIIMYFMDNEHRILKYMYVYVHIVATIKKTYHRQTR